MQRRGLLLATIGAIASAVTPAIAATPSLERVNTSSLITYLQKQMTLICNRFIFEPNDALTREQIKNSITVFLDDLHRKQGIYDYAICTDCISPMDVENNLVKIDLAIKPRKTEHFIYMPIRISSGPVEFKSM